MTAIDELERTLKKLQDSYNHAKDLSSRISILRMINEIEKEIETRKAA